MFTFCHRTRSSFLAILTAMVLLGNDPLCASPDVPAPNEIPDFAMRVRVNRAAEREATSEDSFRLQMGSSNVTFTGQTWSPWVTSTRAFIDAERQKYPNSYNRRWELRFTTSVRPQQGRFEPLDLKVETRVEGETVQQTPSELIGTSLGLLLWREDNGSWSIDTLAGHGRRVYDEAARAAVLPPEDRPQKIIFGERYIGGDNDALAWREGIERLCGLGFNAMHPVPAAYVPVIREGGINRLWGAAYSPPGYAFNFATNRHAIFDDFASNQIASALNAGWEKDEIAFWVTSDEPGWYYPAQYNTFNQNPEAMALFHTYLTERGLRPRDLGATSWDDIKLIGRHHEDTPENRKLFYWSNRFLPWASSRFFGEVTQAFEAHMGEGFPIMVNFNNFIGRLYQPGPVGNNRDRQHPDAAMGQHDWFEFARLRGSTCMATEDWFGDADAAQWSFYATRLRSSAELANIGFGALVIPRTSGQRPEGMAQKLLALVGHGAKNIKFFTYGPEYNFPRNCYAHNTGVYQPLALGMGIVGRAEERLYPGSMPTPDIAILMPQSAQLWDLKDQNVAGGLLDVTNTRLFQRRMAYMAETYGLHLALQHAAVPVQAIDELACNRRDLAQYKVIFLTAPDLPEEAARALVQWVRQGGTLIMTGGSGLHDRYHYPMQRLTDAADVVPDRAVRPLLQSLQQITEGPIVIADEQRLQLYGEHEGMTLGRHAQVVANFEDGTPALTERTLRRGRILRFAGFPGISYRRSAMQSTNGLPSGFCDHWRALITRPLIEAEVTRPVRIDRPLIEAPLLVSEGGAAITLLNWSGTPQEAVRVEVELDREPVRATSARNGPLTIETHPSPHRQQGFTLIVSLDVRDVDVISVDY